MVQLYRAWSIYKDSSEESEINWFVVGRTEPVIPYEKSIIDYDPDYDESKYDELYVNEFFTKKELEDLQRYLSAEHRLELFSQEVPLPVEQGGRPYGLMLISGLKGFYMLAEESEYDLSISVLGHSQKFAADAKKPSLTEQQIGDTTAFLNAVFSDLGISKPDDKKLLATIKNLYNKKGYFVKIDRQ